jgi:hypothetical protein
MDPHTVAAVAAPVRVLGPVTSRSARDWFDWLTGAVQICAGLGALATLLVIWRQLQAAASKARQDRAAEAAAIWNNREFSRILSPVFAYLSVRDPVECTGKIRAWVQARHGEECCLPGDPQVGGLAPRASINDVLHVLGVLEDIALRYNEGEIPRRWVATTLGPNLINVLSESLWLIAFLRHHYRWPSLSCELVTTVQDLRAYPWPEFIFDPEVPRSVRGRRPHRRRPHPIFPSLKAALPPSRVRILCLPPVPGTASRDQWNLAAQASEALSDACTQRALETRPVQPARDPCWQLVVVPPSAAISAPQVSRDKVLSRTLNARISGMSDDEIGQLVRPPAAPGCERTRAQAGT